GIPQNTIADIAAVPINTISTLSQSLHTDEQDHVSLVSGFENPLQIRFLNGKKTFYGLICHFPYTVKPTRRYR
ncbi:hypothetical protein HGM15179_022519, partial [Zosterops borbonicus]